MDPPIRPLSRGARWISWALPLLLLGALAAWWPLQGRRVEAQASLEHLTGRSYDEARVELLSQGWIPRNDVGPITLSGNGLVFQRRGYSELVASSGSGLAPCRFEFRDGKGQVLVVITEGEQAEVGEPKARVAGIHLR